MARNLTLGRTEAKWLVELLEDCDPKVAGTWRHDMAAEVRELFGMAPLEIELHPELYDAIRLADVHEKCTVHGYVNKGLKANLGMPAPDEPGRKHGVQ